MNNPDCPDCPPEPVARELALKLGLNEYLVIHYRAHWRKWVDGGLIAQASYEIDYWHALVRASQRELKLIESRCGDD